jgi:hypothetical protein
MEPTLLFDQIRNFEPDGGNWLPLESMFEQVFASPAPSKFYSAIFQLFEKFPDDDGAGVFWSAVVGMEHSGNYEQELLAYFRRWPTLITRSMLVRIRNAGHTQVRGISIESLIGGHESEG